MIICLRRGIQRLPVRPADTRIRSHCPPRGQFDLEAEVLQSVRGAELCRNPEATFTGGNLSAPRKVGVVACPRGGHLDGFTPGKLLVDGVPRTMEAAAGFLINAGSVPSRLPFTTRLGFRVSGGCQSAPRNLSQLFIGGPPTTDTFIRHPHHVHCGRLSARRTPRRIAVKKFAGDDGAADSGSSDYFLIDALSVPPR